MSVSRLSGNLTTGISGPRSAALAVLLSALAALAAESGVCDWSQRGVHQVPVRPWASFGPSPDNLVFDIGADDDD